MLRELPRPWPAVDALGQPSPGSRGSDDAPRFVGVLIAPMAAPGNQQHQAVQHFAGRAEHEHHAPHVARQRIG